MKDRRRKSITILMADDDQDDCLLVREAFKEGRLLQRFRFVGDGEELMDYLHGRGKYRTRPSPATGAHSSGPEHAEEGRTRSAEGDQG